MKRKIVVTIAVYFIVAIAIFFALLPLIWTFLTSFKTPVDATANPPKWIFIPTLENYIKVFSEEKFPLYLSNSLIISTTCAISLLLIVFPAAYSLARFKIHGKEDILFWLLSTRITPPVIILIPIFIIFKNLNLLDTYPAIILMHMCINLPLALWMLLSFFEGLPKDIEEAAMVDGCSHLGVLLRIVLPLALPGIAVTTLLCFLFSWNEVLFALILTGLNTKTASIAIYNYLTWVEIKWGELSSAAILIMLPPILITFLAQKYIVRGLMIGGALKR